MNSGADLAVTPDQLVRAVRRRLPFAGQLGPAHRGGRRGRRLVGSGESIAQCLTMVRPRGRVVLMGMPGKVTIDLASLWHREVALAGAYAYGAERNGGAVRRTFAIAMEVVAAARLGRLVSARYPLDRFEEAVAHAGCGGAPGAVKVVFEMQTRSRKGPAS